jgi:uncharacterized SAM-binding protein YcdF (DUF218 family)
MRRVLIWGVGWAALLAAMFLSLPHWLEASDPLPARADAIFVFAGQVPDRARCAAELYAKHIAPVIILTGGSVKPELAAAGVPLSDAALNAKLVTDAGVPPAAQHVIPAGTSTWEEAGVLRDWAALSGARNVVAVTSPTHSRRAREALRLALSPLGTQVSVSVCGERYGLASRWWLEERPLVNVTDEALKLCLYIVRYFVPTALHLRPPPSAPVNLDGQVGSMPSTELIHVPDLTETR